MHDTTKKSPRRTVCEVFGKVLLAFNKIKLDAITPKFVVEQNKSFRNKNHSHTIVLVPVNIAEPS